MLNYTGKDKPSKFVRADICGTCKNEFTQDKNQGNE